MAVAVDELQCHPTPIVTTHKEQLNADLLAFLKT